MPRIHLPAYRTLATALCTALTLTTASAQYTPYWFDGFDASYSGFGYSSTDINYEYGTRQGGTPVTYSANTANTANDYHHQILVPGSAPAPYLQLAGDAFAGQPFPDPSVGIVMVSPAVNFSGVGGGGIIGRQITLSLDSFANYGGGVGYTTAGINIGASSALTLGGSASPHFGVRFVEDRTGGTPNFFLQFFDGATLVQNSVFNPAGAGWANVQLEINDLADGNPWDGIGSTTIDVLVNASPVYSYTKGGGGYSDNFITLEGSANLAGFGLATHLFDNLTVFVAPIPEPSTFALTGLGLAALLIFRRRSH